ncbi:helix-turn-helix domain-containing protein [Streptomyces sp. BPPL-273]|uniref:helix-turn-helix domain-containing protein n=1 Tax=Streptomyces TaxID=1883 RepID=UPI00201CDB6E|nr:MULTISPECIES: helix-turn-helix domain-containing protein [Streptomyces]MCL6675103.1 helix-turn-helix domain-containing protein [Streptomyces panaciradicis]WHM31691.1 helix-turn-helix domain-containing protein [Streptomyces sp. BPPL-273]
MTTAAPELLTVSEVMTRLKVGRTKVYDLIRTRRLVSIKVDGCRRIPDDAVRAFIRGQMEEAA